MASVQSDGGMSQLTELRSETFGFTVYYKISENKPQQLSEVVVISEENNRLQFLESHLKSIKLSCENEEVTIHMLIQEAEGVFKKMKEDKESEKTNEIEENEESREIICKFFMKGTCRFGEQCFNSHNVAQREFDGKDMDVSQNVLDPTDENAAGNSNNKSQSKQTKNNKVTASEKPNKKTPMKTATDVINRIQWDEKLHTEDFTVGYLDRFLGVIENSYSSFNWDDITSVDQSILAIPRHRIQYFKYHDEIVWDKNNRLDAVFGSTGSKQKIFDIIEKAEHKEVHVLEN